MPEAATGSAPRPGSFQEATTALEALLSPESDPSEPAKRKPKSPPPAAEATDTDSEVDAEAAPAEDEEVPEEDADADAEEPKSEEEDDQPTESLYTVTIDGKEEQVRASELVAGYQRNQSYTRKSMALAEERKSFESERQATLSERQEYAQLIPKLRAALTVQEPNWAELKAKDPAAYPVVWADWQQNQAKISALAQEESRLSKQQQDLYAQQREQILNEQRNEVLRKLPSWKDPKVAVKEANEIRAVLESVGFTGDELNVYDHRALLLARMAAKYSQSAATRTTIQQRAASAPVVKSGAGPVKKVPKGAEAQARFNKSGTVKDLTAVIEGML
jgi:hypothetical protein